MQFFTMTPSQQSLLDLNSAYDRRRRINEILDIYEKKYRVFTALNLEKKILEKINHILMQSLNIDIEKFYESDYPSFLMIIASFFGRKHALDVSQKKTPIENHVEIPEKDHLQNCNSQLHTIMVMCYAAHEMQDMLEKNDVGQNLRNEKYEQLKNYLEELACDIINHLYLTEIYGPQLARHALQADYKSSFPRGDCVEGKGVYRQYLNRKFNQSMEIMAIAYKAKAMKFLSQRPCLTLMKSRNECGNTNFNNCQNHQLSFETEYSDAQEKSKFRISMRKKLFIHTIFRVIYILTFAYMLCRYPTYDDRLKKESMQVVPFCYVISVLLAQFFMTIIKMIDFVTYNSRKCSEKKHLMLLVKQYYSFNKLALYRLLMIMALVFLETVRFVFFLYEREIEVLSADGKRKITLETPLWSRGLTIIPIVLEVLYCILFAIAAVSSLRLFHFVRSLGFFVYLFKKMCKTVAMFVLIFTTFWFVLAVIHVSISRTFATSNNTMIYTVISKGKFEIFGEVSDEDRQGELEGCSVFNRTILDFFEMGYEEASCLVRSSLMPFLVFTYMFVSGILLINLLTAQLTKEYENESDNSRYYEGYLRYEQLAKIESKIFLPPPFSIIYVLLRIFFCCCFIVEILDGYAWGSVRKPSSVDSMAVESAISAFLNRERDEVWDKAKQIIEEYRRGGVNSANIRELKNEFNKLLDGILSEVEERARTATHMSRMESNGFSAITSSEFPYADDADVETVLP